MSNPRIVHTELNDDYGWQPRRAEQDIVDDLVAAHNELVEYLAKRDGLVKNDWSDTYKAPQSNRGDKTE